MKGKNDGEKAGKRQNKAMVIEGIYARKKKREGDFIEWRRKSSQSSQVKREVKKEGKKRSEKCDKYRREWWWDATAGYLLLLHLFLMPSRARVCGNVFRGKKILAKKVYNPESGNSNNGVRILHKIADTEMLVKVDSWRKCTSSACWCKQEKKNGKSDTTHHTKTTTAFCSSTRPVI